MNQRFIKYLICLMFVFTQIQMFANQNKNDNPWSNIVTSPIINIYDYLPQSFKSNTSILNNDLRLDVTVNDKCVNKSGTSHTYTFTVTNVGDNTAVLSNSNQATINFSRPDGAIGEFTFEGIGTSGTYGDWSWSRTSNYNYTFKYPASGTKELSPGEEVKFSISRSYSITSEGNSRILEANLTYNQDANNDNNFSRAVVSRKPADPKDLKAKLNPLGRNLLYNTLDIKFEDVDKYVFYKKGSEIPFDKMVERNDLSEYTYKNSTKYSGCLSDNAASITFSFLDESDLPSPGSITTVNNEVCYGGEAVINNESLGQGTSVIGESLTRYALKYTWEVSYDNGETWQAPTDTTGSDSEGKNSITISEITTDFLIRRKATERPTTTRGLYYNYTNPVAIKVVQNKIIFPEGTTNVVATRLLPGETLATAKIPVLKASIPGSKITYYNSDGVPIATNPTGSNITIDKLGLGEHIFEVVAENEISNKQICSTSELIKVIVYNANDCSAYTKRIFATHYKGWTSGLSGYKDLEKLTDGNRASAGEINGGVVLLGIGTVGVDLYFTDGNGKLLNLVNKKVVIKIGEQYSGLKLAGGISVRGIKTSESVDKLSIAPKLVGATFGVKGGVLDALKGDNVFEYSFIPADKITEKGKPVEFNGVRVQLGSLVGVADLATVFYAYIEEEGDINGENDITTAEYCQLINEEIKVTPPSSLNYPTSQKNSEGVDIGGIANTNITLNRSVEDAFWGNYSQVLNVASSLNPVIYPYYAVDDNYDSYSLFSTTLGVLNAQFLQAKLRQTARLGDQVQITLSYPNISVLNLSLLQLGNFKLIYYLNGAKVGEERLEEFRVLDIGLFKFKDKRRVVLSKPVQFMFDKVELTQFSAVSVNLGEGLKVHDIRVNPLLAFDNQKDPKDITPICVASPLIVEKPDDCTTYELSFARVTQFGKDNYVSIQYDEKGNEISRSDVLDYQGNKIYPIEEIEDLTDEELLSVGILNNTFESADYGNQLKAYFNLNFKKLFVGEKYSNGKLLIKLQAIRQGCKYGEPQYLRVDLRNCNSAMINPVIKSIGNYTN